MKRFTGNYARVQETLREILQGTGSMPDSSKAVLKGYQTPLGKFETLLGINVSIALFGPGEELPRVLQRSTFHAAGVNEAAETLCGLKKRFRSCGTARALLQLS